MSLQTGGVAITQCAYQTSAGHSYGAPREGPVVGLTRTVCNYSTATGRPEAGNAETCPPGSIAAANSAEFVQPL